LQKLISAYKLWQEFLPNFPITSRCTLCLKIDALFIETLELIFLASYSTGKNKLEYIQKVSTKFDLLKFFLQVMWETKILDSKKYIHLSKLLNLIGKMLGGWLKQSGKEPSA